MDITNIVFDNGLVKEIQRVLYVVKIFCSIKYKMVLRGGKHHRHKKKKHKRKKRVSLSKRVERTWRSLKRKTQKRRRRTRRASKRLRGGGGGGAYKRGGTYQVGGRS